MSILSKGKRQIYARKVKGFWEEFQHNKIGFAGLLTVLIYVGVAIISPILTPYDPVDPPTVATEFAMPQWITIFPGHENLPPTMWYYLSDMKIVKNSSSVDIAAADGGLKLNYSGKNSATIVLSQTIDYQYDPPKEISFELKYGTNPQPPGSPLFSTSYSFELLIETEEENELWEDKFGNSTFVSYGFRKGYTPAEVLSFDAFTKMHDMREWIYCRWSGGHQYDIGDFEEYLPPSLDPAPITLSKTGKYNILLKVSFEPPMFPPETEGNCTLHLKKGEFMIRGSVFGILGTDSQREDVWTHLIAGVRISLIVGILAAIIATSLGILIGVLAGYLGGIVDELSMRIVDILLCLPVLPLLLILISYFSPNVYYVVLLIAIFGWQGLSRIIRSRVLSVREMPFIESARAAGASDLYIVTRHLIPNVIPVAMTSMILAVPGAILTEAALSFIGFGDPNVPTWGRMLHRARESHAFHHLAWWNVLPPGLAITFLCLGFVFIGHAVDEIVNPRLRRRR